MKKIYDVKVSHRWVDGHDYSIGLFWRKEDAELFRDANKSKDDDEDSKYFVTATIVFDTAQERDGFNIIRKQMCESRNDLVEAERNKLMRSVTMEEGTSRSRAIRSMNSDLNNRFPFITEEVVFDRMHNG